MRKLFVFSFTVLSIYLSGCKKSDSVASQNAGGLSLVSEAKAFFENDIRKISTTTELNSHSPNFQKVAEWKNAYVSKKSSNSFVVVPLKYEQNIGFKSNIALHQTFSMGNYSKLVMYKDASGKFKTEVYTYIPNDDYLNGRTQKFSGIILKNNWQGTDSKSFLFKDGKYKELKDNQEQTLQTTQSSQSNSGDITCYVLSFYSCEVDGNGGYTDCVLISSSVIGCYDVNGAEQNEWIPPCDDNGCPQVVYLEEYAATTIETFTEEAIATLGTETADPNTGRITLNVGYNWKCGKGSSIIMSGSFNWTYWSYETGVVEKQNQNDTWKFQSLSHSSIQRIGQTDPLHSYSHQLGYAVPNILDGRRLARMEIEYVVYQQIIQTGSTKSWHIPASTICKAP